MRAMASDVVHSALLQLEIKKRNYTVAWKTQRLKTYNNIKKLCCVYQLAL